MHHVLRLTMEHDKKKGFCMKPSMETTNEFDFRTSISIFEVDVGREIADFDTVNRRPDVRYFSIPFRVLPASRVM